MMPRPSEPVPIGNLQRLGRDGVHLVPDRLLHLVRRHRRWMDKECELFVMAGAGVDDKLAIDNLKNKTVLLVDSDTPPSSKIAGKPFRLAYAVVAVAVNALEQGVYALECLLVTALPRRVFLPRPVMPKLLHDTVLRRRPAGRRGLDAEASSTSSASTRSW